jgi:hypothetical protein
VWVSQGTWAIIKQPKIVSDWWVETKPKVMAELRHYWLGSKVLVAGMWVSFAAAVSRFLSPLWVSVGWCP